MSTYKKSVIK